MKRYFIRIPVERSVIVPKEDGTGDEVAIFYSENEYFLLSTEQARFFDLFLEEEDVTPVAPPAPVAPVKPVHIALREQLLAGKGKPVTYVEPARREDAPATLVEGDAAILAGLGIKLPGQGAPALDWMRVNDEAGPDGNDLNDETLQALIRVLENPKAARQMREQAMDRMLKIPMTVLYRSAAYTHLETRKHIASVRAQQINMGESVTGLPMDLAGYVAGGSRTQVAVDMGDDQIAVLGNKKVSDIFDIGKLGAKDDDDGHVVEAENRSVTQGYREKNHSSPDMLERQVEKRAAPKAQSISLLKLD